MNQIFNNMVKALTTNSDGFSARKLSAFVIIICVIAAHVKWITLGDFTQLEMVLTIDFSFIAGCLGMTTYETIKKMKEENKQTNIETKEENKQTNIENAG